MSPRFIFIVISIVGLALGFLSSVWPRRSIGLYEWVMERFNWKVTPIDEAREIRNTRMLGVVLTALSLVIFYMAFSCL